MGGGMSYSLNEIEAMSKRAARGSGLAWGLAEEAAKATRWLAGFGYPSAELLVNLLELNDKLPAIDLSPSSLEGIWRAPAARMSPLISGAAISDCAQRMQAGQPISIEAVSYPLLIVPFAAGAALRLGGAVAVAWGAVRMVTDGKRLCVQGDGAEILAVHASHVHCSAPAVMEAPIAMVTRADVSQEVWARLGVFAQRTYAPASEASRLLGAGDEMNNKADRMNNKADGMNKTGAGLNDND